MRNYDPNDVNEPDWEYEPEEVELCAGCKEPATLKLGNTSLCCGCNLACVIYEGVRSDYAECEGAD